MFKNVYKNKTVLITGVTGFKGSWLAIWLKYLGAKVIGYALPPKTKNDNFVVSGLNKQIRFIQGDIRNAKKVEQIFKKYRPQFAFHLAAQSLVLESYRKPTYTFDTNLIGTVNFFEAVRNCKSVKVAVNVTSDKCYKNRGTVHRYTEKDRLGGHDPYSASKAASEIITNSYFLSYFNQKNSANIASARAGNVIGGGDWAQNRIVPDCVRALLRNKSIIIRNPNSVRPWQHVLEPLNGYLTLGSYLNLKGKRFSGSWNFGPTSKNMIPVRKLVDETIKQWGKGRAIMNKNAVRKHEANLLQLSINKAKTQLKWKPKLNFKETVNMTISEYKIQRWPVKKVYNQRIQHIEKYSSINK